MSLVDDGRDLAADTLALSLAKGDATTLAAGAKVEPSQFSRNNNATQATIAAMLEL